MGLLFNSGMSFESQPILVTFLANLQGHFMVVATILMSHRWDPIMPLGNLTGSHTPMVPGSTARQGPPPMPFPPGAPMLPTTLPVHAPPVLHQSMGTSPGLCHQPCEPHPTHSSAPPTPAGGIDFKALEDRLDAAFTQKLETLAETLKASWTKPKQSPPVDPILTSSSSSPVVPALTLPTPLTPTTLDQHQQAGIGEASALNPSRLPIKAKLPLPPKLAQSAQKPTATPRRRRSHSPQDALPSRRSRTRHRPIYRSRSHSHRHTRGSYEEKGSGPIDILTLLLHLVKDFLPELPDLHHPVHEIFYTVSM